MTNPLSSKTFIVSKKIISRKNQDGTVIIMLLDDSNCFFKLDHLTATVWSFLQRPLEIDLLNQAIEKTKSLFQIENLESSISNLITEFLNKHLIEETLESANKYTADEMIAALTAAKDQTIQAIAEYDLAKLEEEVLNESVYLDVFAGSDLNLKTNVLPLQNSLSKVLALDTIAFNWKDSRNTNREAGLIAQQVQALFPELVATDDREQFLAVAYQKMIPYLVDSIKELNQKIETQAKLIEKLRAGKNLN